MSQINKIETGERIRKLREAAAETQADLAILLEVKRQIISYYENGTRVPTLEHLIFIADHYNTTTDYLLGLSKTPTTDKDLQFVCDYTCLQDDVLDNLTHNPICVDILNYLLADGNMLNFVTLCVQFKAYKQKHFNLIEFLEQIFKDDMNSELKFKQGFDKHRSLVDSCDLTEYQIKKQVDIILNSFCKVEKEKISVLTADFVNTDFYKVLQTFH